MSTLQIAKYIKLWRKFTLAKIFLLQFVNSIPAVLASSLARSTLSWKKQFHALLRGHTLIIALFFELEILGANSRKKKLMKCFGQPIFIFSVFANHIVIFCNFLGFFFFFFFFLVGFSNLKKKKIYIYIYIYIYFYYFFYFALFCFVLQI